MPTRIDHLSTQEQADVECFFSSMRDSIGQNFTAKEAKFGMQKIVGEFSKRADPELPSITIHHHTLDIMKGLTLNLTKHLKERLRRNVSLEESNPQPLFHGVQQCQLGGLYQLGPHFIICHWSYLLLLMDLYFYLNIHMLKILVRNNH